MDLNRTRKVNSFLGKFPLLGLKSEANIITLDTSHLIRRGTKKEIREISRKITLSNHKSFEYILFYSYKSTEAFSYPEEIINHFKILNVFFTIFKPGSIGIPYCNHYVKNEEDNTYSSIGFISDPRLQYYAEETYSISRQETFLIKSMWTKYIIQFSTKNSGFQTAIRRFYFSSQRFDKEDKVIDLMIAFEALFLIENAELSLRLSLRVAMFLEDEFIRSELFEFMKNAYNIRSKFVHGVGLNPEGKAIKLNDLEIKIVIKKLYEILRLSIRKYVNNFSDVPISDFIKCIDDKIISGQ